MWSLFDLGLTSLSLLAAGAAIWSYVRVRRALRGASSRSLQQLEAAVTELDFGLKSLGAQHKRLNSRVAMREARSVREEQEQPTQEPSSRDERLIKLREIARAKGFRL